MLIYSQQFRCKLSDRTRVSSRKEEIKLECKKCDAYGIDNLGFMGCLIRNSMLDFPSGKVGCYKRKTTILKQIEKVKGDEPRAKYYKWR